MNSPDFETIVKFKRLIELIQYKIKVIHEVYNMHNIHENSIVSVINNNEQKSDALISV